jgi:hypothetical protein
LIRNISHTSNRARQSERGVAAVVVLFALAVFSVLSLSVLGIAPLEATLRLGSDPNLHVVLYASAKESPRVVGRLNMPTAWRHRDSQPEGSLEVRAPGPGGIELAADMPAGWTHSVQVAPGLRVCCDGGDDACSSVSWDQEVMAASVTPTLNRGLDATSTTHRLHFALSSPGTVSASDIDPESAAESAFLVKADRAGDSEPEIEAGSAVSTVSCRLVSASQTFASGTLRLVPGVDERGNINRVSSGTVELRYNEPRQ